MLFKVMKPSPLLREAVVFRANILLGGYLVPASYTDSTTLDQPYAVVHVPDDLVGDVAVGGYSYF
jgi:hypothetical protein